MSVAFLEDSPLEHSRRANEAVGSTTTVIQQHLTSFALQAVDFEVGVYTRPRCPHGPPARPIGAPEMALVRLLKRLLKKTDGRYLFLYSKKR